MKPAVLFWSKTGNTRKFADIISDLLLEFKIKDFLVAEIREDFTFNPLDYDVVFLGSPVYRFLPPREVVSFVDFNMDKFKVFVLLDLLKCLLNSVLRFVPIPAFIPE